MDPLDVPEELKDLTYIEKQLIARDVQHVADKLPHLVEDLNNVVVVKLSESITLPEFEVRKDKVLKALIWLKENNPKYSDITIDYQNLDSLPDNGNVYDRITKNVNDSSNNLHDDDVDNVDDIIFSHVPDSPNTSANKSFKNFLIWPSLGTTPINEFSSPSYISLCFPHLYPYGKADYTMPRPHKVKLSEYIQHLMLYKDGRFSKDERFRSKYFLEKSFKNHFDVVDIWYRYEFQHRGSIHLHGLAWFRNAPVLKENMSREEKESFLHYFNNIITCENEDMNLLPSHVHPCQVNLDDVEDVQIDIRQLVNHLQRHTKCQKSHCLRPVGRSKQLECRYKFPMDMRERSELAEEDGNVIGIKFKRNDQLLNKYNKWVLQTWRANIDISPIVNKRIVYRYIAKYASKSEIKSLCYNQVLTDILNTDGDEGEMSKKAIRKLLVSSCAERDYCAQELFYPWRNVDDVAEVDEQMKMYINFLYKKYIEKGTDDYEQHSSDDEDDNEAEKSYSQNFDKESILSALHPKCSSRIGDVINKRNIGVRWDYLANKLNRETVQTIVEQLKNISSPKVVSITDVNDLNCDQKKVFKFIRELVYDIKNNSETSGCFAIVQGMPGTACIEKRCRDLTECEKLFGNLTVILFGDINQLLPVCDQPLYANIENLSQYNELLERGKVIMTELSRSFILRKCHRFGNHGYVKFLKRVSKGSCTIQDMSYIKDRYLHCMSSSERQKFEDSLRLCSTNDSANEYNLKKILNMNQPIAVIKADNNNKTVFLTSDDMADGLLNVIMLCRGARVMLRRNINVCRGLVNGAIGIVKHIVYEHGKKPPMLPL
ncbi:ATP-dependent DNA helicase [Frankliniella fusca]|nr:ATP-dependent DNA helicase [Frankliniella fusca]